MPWIYTGDDLADAMKRLQHALDLDDVDLVELDAGVWLVREHDPDGDVDPRRAAHRRRQARYRARKKGDAGDAGDASPGDAGDAAESLIFAQFGGEVRSTDRPLGRSGRSIDSPTRDARDADAVTRVTRDAGDALGLDELAADLRLDDLERAVGRRGIAGAREMLDRKRDR